MVDFNDVTEIKYKAEHYSFISADSPMLHFDSDLNHQSCWDTNKVTTVFERAKKHDKALIRQQANNGLPHTSIFITCEKRIRHLIMNNISQSMMQNFDTNGSFGLDFILHFCPLLRSTDMADCLLIDYYSSTSCKTKINSIKRFTMKQCQLDEQNLTKISLNMRLLKHVSLIGCIFTGSVPHIVIINMPSTSFEALIYTDTVVLVLYQKFISKLQHWLLAQCIILVEITTFLVPHLMNITRA